MISQLQILYNQPSEEIYDPIWPDYSAGSSYDVRWYYNSYGRVCKVSGRANVEFKLSINDVEPERSSELQLLVDTFFELCDSTGLLLYAWADVFPMAIDSRYSNGGLSFKGMYPSDRSLSEYALSDAWRQCRDRDKYVPVATWCMLLSKSHQERLQDIEGLLGDLKKFSDYPIRWAKSEFLQNGNLYIRDGGIAYHPSWNEKGRDRPFVMSDLSSLGDWRSYLQARLAQAGMTVWQDPEVLEKLSTPPDPEAGERWLAAMQEHGVTPEQQQAASERVEEYFASHTPACILKPELWNRTSQDRSLSDEVAFQHTYESKANQRIWASGLSRGSMPFILIGASTEEAARARFDPERDGYETHSRRSKPRTKPFACKRCERMNFSLRMVLDYEFEVLSLDEDMAAAPLEELYSWCLMTATCQKCGKEYTLADWECA